MYYLMSALLFLTICFANNFLEKTPDKSNLKSSIEQSKFCKLKDFNYIKFDDIDDCCINVDLGNGDAIFCEKSSWTRLSCDSGLFANQKGSTPVCENKAKEQMNSTLKNIAPLNLPNNILNALNTTTMISKAQSSLVGPCMKYFHHDKKLDRCCQYSVFTTGKGYYCANSDPGWKVHRCNEGYTDSINVNPSLANGFDLCSPEVPASEVDTDGDGIPDVIDDCPSTLPGAGVLSNGCGPVGP